MKLIYRDIDLEKDIDTILLFHCKINYECESELAGKIPFDLYQKKWLSFKVQTDEFTETMRQSLNDSRTVAKIIEDDERSVIGYIWVRFFDNKDYNIVVADIQDIFVSEENQDKGIGLILMNYIEKWAFDNGANILRSGTGSNNMKSIRLHEKSGFKPYRIEFEKILR